MKGRRANHEGSIYQSKDGRWIGELTVRARRRRVSGKSKREVSQRLRILRTEIENANQRSGDNLTVESALKRLSDPMFTQRGNGYRSVTSTETHQWACNVWMRTSLRTANLAEVRAEDVERAYSQMRTRAGTPYSRRSMKQIRSVLLQGMRSELTRTGSQLIQVAVTSAESARFPASVRPAKAKRALTRNEVAALLPVLRETENGLVFGISLLLGLRPSEAAGLRLSSVDLPRNILYVSAARRRSGTGLEVSDGLKTRNSRRTLEIPESLKPWFVVHIRQREGKGLSPQNDDLLFTNSAGGILDPSRMRRQLRKLCEKAGIESVTPNELRHTAATHMAEKLPLHHVAQILGHSVEVADEFYWHRSLDVLKTPDIAGTGVS